MYEMERADGEGLIILKERNFKGNISNNALASTAVSYTHFSSNRLNSGFRYNVIFAPKCFKV